MKGRVLRVEMVKERCAELQRQPWQSRGEAVRQTAEERVEEGQLGGWVGVWGQGGAAQGSGWGGGFRSHPAPMGGGAIAGPHTLLNPALNQCPQATPEHASRAGLGSLKSGGAASEGAAVATQAAAAARDRRWAAVAR